MSRDSRESIELSIVVPLYNEVGTLHELHRRLNEVVLLLGQQTEIIYIDDGSSDATWPTIEAIGAHDPRVQAIRLARNYGQTAALAAGFDAARGAVIVAMDGDLQHEPEEIPKLLAKLEEGYDVVSGWRERRVDGYLTRRLPSKIANWLMAKLSGVSLHDFGTTFKAYRAPVIKRVRLYGDLHRFIPALTSWNGARIAEVPIKNIPRPQNASHYGLSRTWRVMADLLTVRFLLKYVTRPLHLFGPAGFASAAAGIAAAMFVLLSKLLTGTPVFLSHGPLLLFSAVLIQTGILLVGLGLLAELLTRIYMDGEQRKIYTVAVARTAVAPISPLGPGAPRHRRPSGAPAVTRPTIAAATILAIALQAVPHAAPSPHVAAVALTSGQRHHYTIAGRVRPLLFWIGNDDVGDAVVSTRRDADSSAYALLIGSDPARAPRSINRWGYIAEELRGTEATIVGLMTESNESSVAQAEANLARRGESRFDVIRESVSGGEARSVVRSVAAPSTLTLRQVDTVLDLADRSGTDGQARVVPMPPGTRPGFLSAVADLMHAQAAEWRTTNKVHASERLPFVYHGKLYQLRATRSRLVDSQRIGATTYNHLIASQFQISNPGTNTATEFSITFAADGALAEMPISVSYQPRWWLEIELTLDDSKAGPLLVAENAR